MISTSSTKNQTSLKDPLNGIKGHIKSLLFVFICTVSLLFSTNLSEAQTYCTPAFSYTACQLGNNFWITNTTFGTLNASLAGCSSGLQAPTGSVTAGQTYTLSITKKANTYKCVIQAWADWNNDGLFTGTGEPLLTVTETAGGSNIATASITVPAAAHVGTCRLRVMVNYSGAGGTDGCSPNAQSQGEYLDYNITVIAGCTPPTTNGSAGSVTNITNNQCNISFTRGNGTGGVLVVARANATASVSPTSGTAYSGASTVFGSGTTTGTGNYIVYDGTANGTSTATSPLLITGLTPGTTYAFDVYEFASPSCYTSSPYTFTVNIPICLPPSPQASSGSTSGITTASAHLNWTSGGGTGGELVIINQGSAVSTDPSQNTTYTANSAYGSGSLIGTGRVVFAGTGGTVNVTNLAVNTTYYYAIYTYYSSGPCYATPALTGSFTTSNGAMTYLGAVTSQISSGVTVSQGAANQQIIQVQVNTGPGTSPALTLSSLNFNTNGSTLTSTLGNDITAARIFYTTTNTFSTGIQFGSDVTTFPGGSTAIPVSGSQILQPNSTNYFWLVYDINIGGTVGDALDAECPSINVGSAQTPSPTAPAGNRTIASLGGMSCAYTGANISSPAYSSIYGVSGIAPTTTAVSLATGNISNTIINSNAALTFPSGFTFIFNDVSYSNLGGVSSNGFIWFGSGSPAATASAPISTTGNLGGSGTINGIISAYGAPLWSKTVFTTLQAPESSQIQVLYTGTSPNRICKIEWCAFVTTACTQNGGSERNRMNFQIWLYENNSLGTKSNTIEMYYQSQNAVGIITAQTAGQIGLRGLTNSSGDWVNRTASTGSWLTSTAGASNAATAQSNDAGVNWIGSNNGNINNGFSFKPSVSIPSVTPTPTASNVCPASTATLTATDPIFATGSTYQWYENSVAISGATSSTYAAPSTGSYLVVASNSGCGKVSTPPVAVTISSCGPTAYAVSGGPYCGTGTITLANSQTGVSYQLMNGVSPVGSSQSGTTGSPLTFTPPINTSGSNITYTIVGTQSLVSTTMTGSVVVNSLPTAGISGTATGCGSVSLTATGGTSYTWSGGSTPYTASNTFASSNTYIVTVSDANTCSATASQSVTVNTNPTAGITGTSTACGSVSLIATGGTGYLWSGGSSTSTADNTFSSSATYIVTVTDANNCSSTASQVVTVKPTPAATASNTGPYIPGQTISLSSGPSGQTSYSWSGPQSFTAGTQNASRTGATSLMSGNYVVTVTNSVGCSDTAITFVSVNSLGDYVWTGATNTSWTTVTNWSPTAPVGGPSGCTENVVIPNTVNDPVISSAVSIGNVTINDNAQLTLNGNLSICGFLAGGVATPPLIVGASHIILNGSTSQVISGMLNTNYLEINNSSGAGVNTGTTANVTVNKALILTSGNFTALNGSTVTLVSNSGGDGYLDNFTSSTAGSYIGNLAAQRYIGNAADGYRDLSSPVSSRVSDLNASYPVTGQDGVDCWYAYSPYPNLQYYNEQLVIPSASGNFFMHWMSYTSLSHTLPAMKGLSFRTYAGSPYTISFTGNPYSGPHSTTITHTSTVAPANDGWNLIGNPYPSPIQWTKVKAMNAAVSAGSYYVYHTTAEYAGNWGSFNGTTGVNGATDDIALGQGFFVQTANPSTGFVMDNTVRTTTAGTYQSSVHALDNEVRLMLSNGTNSDEIVTYTDADATDGYDAAIDAVKMPAGSAVSISYSLANKDYAINAMSQLNVQTVLPLTIYVGDTGSYTLNATTLNTPGLAAYLRDAETGTLTGLGQNPVSLHLNGGQTYTNRYSVVFQAVNTTTGISSSTASNTQIYSYGDMVYVKRSNPTPATISITNLLGQEIRELNSNTQETSFEMPVVQPWYAIVKVTEGQKVTVAKLLISNK